VEQVFEEVHVARSNALQSKVRARGSYHVGPLARYSLNFDKLHPRAQRAAAAAGLGKTCFNPFKSIVVRCVETVHAVEEALRLIDVYRQPARPDVPFQVKAGRATGPPRHPGACSTTATASTTRATSSTPRSARPPPRAR